MLVVDLPVTILELKHGPTQVLLHTDSRVFAQSSSQPLSRLVERNWSVLLRPSL